MVGGVVLSLPGGVVVGPVSPLVGGVGSDCILDLVGRGWVSSGGARGGDCICGLVFRGRGFGDGSDEDGVGDDGVWILGEEIDKGLGEDCC